MASPQAGTYLIVCAKNSSSAPFVLDVSGGSMSDGANVQIYRPNGTAAQYFTVSYRSGTARIVSRLTGKCVDVQGGSLTSGTNVQMYKSNNTRAQLWLIESDGSTATYRGSSYPTYTIKLSEATGLAMDVSGGTMEAGTNVRVYNANGTDAQRWILVPVPDFSSGGTYEIRSMLSTSMCVDVSGGSGVKGANVQLYHANGTNAQKFNITEETSGHWSIQAIVSKLYLDVNGGSAEAGTNVQQWSDNDTRAQRWSATSYGTTTVNGTTCEVVVFGSYVTDDGATYAMDVENALTTDKANVDIQALDASTKQRFALYPTTPKDADIPVVGSLGWVATVGDSARKLTLPEASRLYPSWVTTGAWATDGANHYEVRHRSQSMDARTGTWSAFGDWCAWTTVAVSQVGTEVWMADGLPATVSSGHRAIQYEFQVRAVVVDDEGDMWVGETTSATLRAVQVATITISTMGFGPEGLRLAYSSDYTGGTNVVQIESVSSGGEELTSQPTLFNALDPSGSMLIPMESLSRWIDDGSTIVVKYRNGTDMLPLSDTSTSHTGTVSYEAGSGLNVKATLTAGRGRTIVVNVTNATATRAWLLMDGELTEMELDGNKAYIMHPFGVEKYYEVFVSAQSGSSWGMAHVTTFDADVNIGMWTPCHAWNWADGCFLLELNEGEPLHTEYTVDRNYGTFQLNDREWESVHYQRTKSGAITAEGVLSSLVSVESTREDLFALCDQGYVTYRSPSGLVMDVAVTGFSIDEGPYYTTVTVTMVQVSN